MSRLKEGRGALFHWQMVMMKNVSSEIRSSTGSLPVDVRHSHTIRVMGNAAVGAGQCCVTFMLDKECSERTLGSHIIPVMTNLRSKTLYSIAFLSVSINIFILTVAPGTV